MILSVTAFICTLVGFTFGAVIFRRTETVQYLYDECVFLKKKCASREETLDKIITQGCRSVFMGSSKSCYDMMDSVELTVVEICSSCAAEIELNKIIYSNFGKK